jgi:RimJ/RimL family protein N-acetyltransferase
MSIAIQKILSLERPQILLHLQKLSEADRYLRFGTYMHDEALAEYVKRIDFKRDKIFGVQSDATQLVGLAHLGLDTTHRCAELGVSVDESHRGRGFGLALLNRAKLTAVNRGYKTLFMYCLAENQIMIHVAQKAGLKLVTSEGAVDARLKLEAASYGGVALEAVEDQIAVADMMLKRFWASSIKAA